MISEQDLKELAEYIKLRPTRFTQNVTTAERLEYLKKLNLRRVSGQKSAQDEVR